jgi:hypothetical protein
MLEKRIKKTIIETKEHQERKLIKETIVKNRLTTLVEHIRTEKDYNNLSEDKKIQLSFNLLQELSYLESNGLINEIDLSGVFKSLFGGLFGDVTQTVFEPLLGKIVYPLFGQGFMSNFIISYLTSRPSDVIKSMSDCKLMTKLVAESVVEGMVMSLQRQKGFDAPGYSYLRNALGSVIEGSEFISGIERSISNTVCGVFSSVAGNAKKVEAKLKTP